MESGAQSVGVHALKPANNYTLGVSGWRLHGQRTGVGRYLLNVIGRWTPELVSQNFAEATLYTPHTVDRRAAGLPEGLRVTVRESRLPMIPWDNLRVAPAATQSVMLYPSYSRPLLARGATVVVTHDATLRLHPELFTRRDRAFYAPLYGWSARAATLVIATTHAAKGDIAREWDVNPDKIRVTHLAAAPCFQPLPGQEHRGTLRTRATGADIPFFLFVGKLSGRRNVPLLLRAFAEFRWSSECPHRLVAAGPDDSMREVRSMSEAMQLGEFVVTRSFLPDGELNELYNCADALVMPSAYETMSLPTMEAQAAGTPVISIDTPGSREITGGAALLIPKLTVGELADAMTRLASDAALRSDIAERGLVNSRRFSWERCASETLAICREAAEMVDARRRA